MAERVTLHQVRLALLLTPEYQNPDLWYQLYRDIREQWPVHPIVLVDSCRFDFPGGEDGDGMARPDLMRPLVATIAAWIETPELNVYRGDGADAVTSPKRHKGVDWSLKVKLDELKALFERKRLPLPTALFQNIPNHVSSEVSQNLQQEVTPPVVVPTQTQDGGREDFMDIEIEAILANGTKDKPAAVMAELIKRCGVNGSCCVVWEHTTDPETGKPGILWFGVQGNQEYLSIKNLTDRLYRRRKKLDKTAPTTR